MTAAPKPTPIYHMTQVSNLRSIIEATGLLSTNELHRLGIRYKDSSYQDVQDRRATTCVPCGVGGVLHDYVPFYFNPRSPMLGAIHVGRVPSCPEGQRAMIHLMTSAQKVKAAGHEVCFTNAHAITRLANFYLDFNSLDLIDWALMKSKWWNDIPTDPDRSRRRQAEFLVHKFVPFELVIGIGVINDDVREQVEAELKSAPYHPPVKVKPEWYY
jgi:hypothetical protein